MLSIQPRKLTGSSTTEPGYQEAADCVRARWCETLVLGFSASFGNQKCGLMTWEALRHTLKVVGSWWSLRGADGIAAATVLSRGGGTSPMERSEALQGGRAQALWPLARRSSSWSAGSRMGVTEKEASKSLRDSANVCQSFSTSTSQAPLVSAAAAASALEPLGSRWSHWRIYSILQFVYPS